MLWGEVASPHFGNDNIGSLSSPQDTNSNALEQREHPHLQHLGHDPLCHLLVYKHPAIFLKAYALNHGDLETAILLSSQDSMKMKERN